MRRPRPQPASDADRVVYFHGCSTNTYEPHIGKLAVAVLEHIGLHVELPPQTCCGLPAQSNGDFAAARRYARTNVESLVEYARRGIPIVGPSASCITALKGDYHHVLGLDLPTLQALNRAAAAASFLPATARSAALAALDQGLSGTAPAATTTRSPGTGTAARWR